MSQTSPPKPGKGNDNAERHGGDAMQLGALVPRLYLQHPDREGEHVYEGAVVFADISGFTTLTEALSSRGPEGSEVLNRLLNAYFSPLIDAIEEHGGYLLNLAGDALNALFHTEGEGGDSALARAARCALAIQRITLDFKDLDTPIGKVTLTIKVAVATGRVHTAVAGSASLCKSFISYGSGLDNAAMLEKLARPGQIMVDPEVAQAVAGASLRPVERGVCELLEAPTHESQVPERLPLVATADQIRDQIHPVVWPYLSKGAGAFLSSLRLVTAVFIGFSEQTHSPSRFARLARYYDLVQGLVDRYRGFTLGYDAGDKGSKLIALFGAPQAVEQATARAVECALDLQEKIDAVEGIDAQCIGIATGALYVGLAGGAGQYRYTAMGDAMNLAARLMKHARPGTISVDKVTRDRAGDVFQWGQGEEVMLKGKLTPVEVSQVTRRQDTVEVTPFHRRGRGLVGRDSELRRIREYTEATLTGRGQVLRIVGDAGIGKSRLLEPLIAQATEVLEVPALVGTCADYTKGLAYKPWAPALNHIFGIRPRDPGNEARILSIVEHHCPDQLERAGLLGPLLGVPMEMPELFKNVPHSEQQQLAEDLVVDVLCAVCKDKGLILVFDDAHWMDSSSASLLRRVARRVRNRPILIAVALRPPKDAQTQELLEALEALPHGATFDLTPLRPEDIEIHACHRLGARSLGPDVLNVLLERSQCNPLVMEELCDLLAQSEQLVIKRGCARLKLTPEQLVMPESVSGLVLARLDHMSAEARIAIQVASVLGRHFTLDQLVSIHPHLKDRASIQEALAEAHRMDILRVERDSGGEAYFFKHVLSQEAVYSSLTFEVRRELHTTTAAYFESLCGPENRAEMVPLIAEHYRRTDNREKLRIFAPEAGHLALERHLNRVAASWFFLDAEIHRREGALKEECQALALTQDALTNLGDLEEQRRVLGRWEEVVTELGDERGLAQVLSAKVVYLHRRGQSAAALEVGSRAETLLKRVGDAYSLLELKLGLSSIYLESRELDRAEACLLETRPLIDELGDLRLKGRFLGQQGILLMMQGNPADALTHLTDAQELAKEVGDPTSEVHVVGTIGILHYRLRQFAKASTHLSQAADLSRRLGNLRQEGRHRFNLACCAAQLGRLETAREQCVRASVLFERTDYTLGELCTQVNLLHVHWLEGAQPSETEDLRDRLYVHQDQLTPPHRGEYLWILAELSYQAGDPSQALVHAAEAVECAEQNSLAQVKIEALSVAALSHSALGHHEDALRAIRGADLMRRQESVVLDWPSRFQWRRHLVLKAAGLRAEGQQALDMAAEEVQKTLHSLSGEDVRDSVLRHLSWHKEILSAVKAQGSPSTPRAARTA